MLITRVSAASGNTNSLELPITEEQYRLWERGMLAQRAFPELTAAQREFIISGTTEAEWKELYGMDEVDQDTLKSTE